jgi:HTH-type transcriptional regulator/antitoxin HigA
MEIRPIRTESDYKVALDEVERLFEATPGTAEFDRLDVLATLIEAYEAKLAPIEPPDPVAAIEFALDRLALTPADLEPVIGSKERVAAILAKRQRLTLPMIRRVSAKLGIPVAILVQPYSVAHTSRRVAGERVLSVSR